MAEHEIRFRQATENDVSTLLWLIQVRQVMSTPIVAANGEGCVSGWEPKIYCDITWNHTGVHYIGIPTKKPSELILVVSLVKLGV